MQEMAWQLKGKVAQCNRREYGFAKIHVERIGNGADALFEGLGGELEVRGGGCTVTALQAHLKFFEGLDVPWGSTLRNSSRLPRYWAYFQRSLRSHRPQRQTVVRYSVPSRSHPLSPRARSHRKVRSWHLFLLDTLDNGQHRDS